MNVERVILLTPGFTADEYDRNCQPTLQLFVTELLRQGVEVHIVALDYPFSNKPYQWQGARVYPCGGNNSRWLKPRTIWRAIRICQKIIDGIPIAEMGHLAVHSFWLGWASGIGEFVARQNGLRHITTLMGQDVLRQNRHRFRFLSTERQNRLVVLSDFQNEVLKKNSFYRAAHIIPWGLSSDEIPALLPATCPVDVLGVASLIPLKNWELWLKTISIVAESNPDLRAELIGDGPQRKHLERLAEQLNIRHLIHFSGDLPRPQVLQKMLEAKTLLHCSAFESQGYVLCEAAMNGCRLVATPVGIAPLMAVCAETASDLAALILTAIEQPLLTNPVTPFLMQQSVRAYLELYATP